MKFKKRTGTRAHEARVLPGFQRHLTHKLQTLNLTLSLSNSHKHPLSRFLKKKKKRRGLSQTLTHAQTFKHSLTHKLSNTHSHLHRRQGDSRRRQLLVSSAAVEAVEAFTVPSFSLSLSIGLLLIVSAENPNEPQIIIRNPKFAC